MNSVLSYHILLPVLYLEKARVAFGEGCVHLFFVGAPDKDFVFFVVLWYPRQRTKHALQGPPQKRTALFLGCENRGGGTMKYSWEVCWRVIGDWFRMFFRIY